VANALYPLWKQSLMGDLLSGDVKVALVDLDDYTYSASHQYLSDIPSGARVAISSALTGKSFTGSSFKADDAVFTDVTGDQAEALVLFIDTGDASSSPIVMFQDGSVDGLPITPSGGGIVVKWAGAGIFTL
jgi:hypothetical protein